MITLLLINAFERPAGCSYLLTFLILISLKRVLSWHLDVNTKILLTTYKTLLPTYLGTCRLPYLVTWNTLANMALTLFLDPIVALRHTPLFSTTFTVLFAYEQRFFSSLFNRLQSH